MAKQPHSPAIERPNIRKSLVAYTTGFLLSIALTVEAYLLVTRPIIAGNALILAIAVLAMAQLVVQLVFFLHLSQESRPRWRLIAFSFMILVVAILVFGSVWIMNNLNYNMMPKNLNQYMRVNEGL